MEDRRQGVLAGGNWIIDFVKMIDVYPSEEALANIGEVSLSNGGAPYNVLKALYKLGADFPLEGVGCVGQDENGAYILNDCLEMNIDVGQIKVLEGQKTSYTDVMTVRRNGKRTFFHFRGANSLLDQLNFDFSKSGAKIFHLGYLLLLDQLDKLTQMGESRAADVFRNAKANGFITSADVVSEQSERYRMIIPSSLPYVDLLFINEFEAGMLTGQDIYFVEDVPQIESCLQVARQILKMGVNRWVIIHFKQGALAMNPDNDWCYQESLKIPDQEIKGAVGAGDAFAAGVLYAIHENWPIEDALKLGVSVAASSLTSSGASAGIKDLAGCQQLYDQYALLNRGNAV